MNDREKEFISVKDAYGNHKYTVSVARLYEEFKEELIKDGFIEANPKRWTRPNSEDVTLYFIDKIGRGRDSVDMAESFMNHWDSVDWYTKGKVRIKSWKGRANTWIKNNEKYKRNDSGKTRKLSVAEQVAARIKSKEDANPANTEESGQIVATYDFNVRSQMD